MKTKTFVSLLGLLSLLGGIVTAAPLGTAFTYQGKLAEGGAPATGNYDLKFTLYDAASGGTTVAGPITNSATGVANGLVTVVLDFGTNVFTGDARWLELAARTNGGGVFETLAPRQSLTPAPYALFAANAQSLSGQGGAAFAPAGGSTNYVAKTGDTMSGPLQLPANGLAAGGNQLALNGGRVGIGTSNPSRALSVYAADSPRVLVDGPSGTEPGYEWASDGTLKWLLYRPRGSDDLRLWDTFGDRVTFQRGGNVGIGTSNPGAPLEIAGYGNNLKLTRPGMTNAFGAWVGYWGGNPLLGLGNWATGSGLAVDAAGNVGIGTPAPAAKLQVSSDGEAIRLQGTTYAGTNNNTIVSFCDKVGTRVGWVGDASFLDNDIYLGAEIGNVTLYTLAGKVLTATSSGSVGIGTTAPAAKLDVAGTVRAASFQGDGSGLTGIAVTMVTNAGWGLSGNSGTTASNFLGTTDGHPLELRVSGQRALRLEPCSSLLVNVIGGAGCNSVGSGVAGATIAGGGFFVYSPVPVPHYLAFGNEVDQSFGTIGGGWANTVGGGAATIAGGTGNTVANGADYSVIGGGNNNSIGAAAAGATIAGGQNNLIATNCPNALVGGGSGNVASGYGAAVAGGQGNTASGRFATVTGGEANTASGLDATTMGAHSAAGGEAATALGISTTANGFASLASGSGSLASGDYSTAMGNQSLASGYASTALGYGSTAQGFISTVAGYRALASGDYSVAMGNGSVASNTCAMAFGSNTVAMGIGSIAMGSRSSATGLVSTAIGFQTAAWGGYSTAMGNGCIASGWSSIAMGDQCQADFGAATAIGADCVAVGRGSFAAGEQNSAVGSGIGSADIALGYGNAATGFCAVAVGYSARAIGRCAVAVGNSASATESDSLAAGSYANAQHKGSMVLCDDSRLYWEETGGEPGPSNSSTTTNEFTARFTGGFRLITGIETRAWGWPPSAGVSLASYGTSWSTICDRNAKKDFAPVDSVAVLEQLARVPVTRWHYCWEDESAPTHLGPVAQDFKAAFYPGTDDKTITTLEFDGVALAAIQGLNQKLEEALKRKDAENAELKQRLAQLEQVVQQLTK